MPRLLFEKTGSAVWISHLDLMRLFQRAFKRAGLLLKHTQGFNPRPSVSIALPLSVGMSSHCELLDFELEGANIPCDTILRELNRTLVEGLHVLAVYDKGRKIGDLTLLDCSVLLKYSNGIDCEAVSAITDIFQRESLVVPKKTKNGMQQQDIIPMIKRICVSQKSSQEIEMRALVCCQNPTLNPAQLAAAVSNCLPQYAPDFCLYVRHEIFDASEKVFR